MPANHVLLQRTTLTASAASVTFDLTGVSGYTDLRLVYSVRSTRSANDDAVFLRVNADTASNYSYRFLRGDGSSAGSGSASTTFIYAGQGPAANATSNTFGNMEVYIPNYSGSTAKSISVDAVSENNATGAWTMLAAGRWSQTGAITSLTLYPETGPNFAAGSSFSLYGIANAATTPASAPKADGGDIIKTDGTYWYHAFLSSGTFKPQVNLSADILVVGGGGAGGVRQAGGGGAGGLLAFASQALSASTSYTTVVGAGGTGTQTDTSPGANGSDSQFGSLTLVKGGGGGGSNSSVNGVTGGSGGGGAVGGTGAAGTSGQGNSGGNGVAAPYYASGGGGGAGGTGANNSGSTGGAGGVGVYSTLTDLIGPTVGLGQLVSSHYYFAGGGGAGSGGGLSGGTGGSGGGANGGADNANGSNGTAGTGGGGGGSGGSNGAPFKVAGNGGSGVVIIKYAV